MPGIINFGIVDLMDELGKDERWNVLTVLISRSNIRMRCWPSMRYIARKLKASPNKVGDAKEWLAEHGAIEIVPYNKRIGDELRLPPAQHIYQITGELNLDGKTGQYLYFGAPPANVTDGDNNDVIDGNIINGDNVTKYMETKSIPTSPPANNRVVGTTTFRHVKVSDDVVATDIDKGKPERQKTALELRLLNALPGQRGVPKVFDKLADDVATTIGILPPPNVMYDTDPLFRDWIEGRIAYWQTQKKEAKHLVALVKKYDGYAFGWVQYRTLHMKTRAADDKKEAEVQQEISKIEGVKDAPTWAQNPDEIPDDIFGEG